MSDVLRFLFLAGLFFLDVHVRASTKVIAAEDARKVTVQEDARTVVLGRKGLLEQRDEHTWHLVRGTLYAEATADERFETPFMVARCQDRCQILMERHEDAVQVSCLSGTLQVVPVGDIKPSQLEAGLGARFGRVGPDGKSISEIPQSLPWDKTVRSWAVLWPGDLREFKTTLLEFRKTWQDGVERASLLHSSKADRAIASEQERLRRMEVLRGQREREDAKLRALFREKAWVNP
ncbi:MAG: hypothetical protein AB7F86_00055 [Bdellovibrionales bacterium]